MRERKLDVGFERQLDAEARGRRRRLAGTMAWSLALALAAGASTLAARLAPSDEPAGAVGTLEAEVGVVQQAVGSVYAGQSGHAGLDDAMLAASGSLPPGMVFGRVLRHSLGGRIVVAGTSGGWTVRFEGLPGWACVALASSGVQDAATAVRVSSGSVSAIADGGAMERRAARAACAGDGSRSVEWSFR